MAVITLTAHTAIVPDEVDLDETNSGLDKPTGHQDRLTENMQAVAITDRAWLGIDIERRLGSGSGKVRYDWCRRRGKRGARRGACERIEPV